MRFYFDLEQNREEYRALTEVLAELGHELGEGGIPVTLKTCEKGVQLSGDGKAYTLAAILERYSGHDFISALECMNLFYTDPDKAAACVRRIYR